MKKEKFKSVEAQLGDCITDMLFYVNQLHLCHWLTLKNHHHVVVGELYSELESELDGLAEQFIGACLPELRPEEALNLSEGVTEARYYKVIKSEKEILAIIKEITDYATKGLAVIEKTPKFLFMRDGVMDMIAELHSAKYKITQQ